MTKARTLADNFAADINGITAGTGITGGGTSGTVTITNEMATTITAKGDLLAGTGNAAFDNLAAGSNGDTLLADSAATTGLRWSAQPAASNLVINSAMQIWQRGTSFAIPSSANTYTADRWSCYRGATGVTVSRQLVSDTTNLPFIQYAARVQRDSGNTSTVIPYLSQNFETVNSIPFAGKTLTVSFYARAGANYSSTSSLLQIQLLSGTGTDQNWLGYTGTVFAINTGKTLSTTWQRFTATATIETTATELALVVSPTNLTGTAWANDWFEVTGVQIDVGNVALPFRTQGVTLAGELAACQRYYYRFANDAINKTYFLSRNFSTTAARGIVFYPVTMRTAPTFGSSAASTFSVWTNTDYAGTSISGFDLNTTAANIQLSVASGLTANDATAVLSSSSSTTSYLEFSSEL